MFLQFSVSQGRVKKDFIIFAKFSAENNPFFSSTCSEMEIPLCVFDTFIKMRRWGHHPCWILRVWVILLYFFLHVSERSEHLCYYVFLVGKINQFHGFLFTLLEGGGPYNG